MLKEGNYVPEKYADPALLPKSAKELAAEIGAVRAMITKDSGTAALTVEARLTAIENALLALI